MLNSKQSSQPEPSGGVRALVCERCECDKFRPDQDGDPSCLVCGFVVVLNQKYVVKQINVMNSSRFYVIHYSGIKAEWETTTLDMILMGPRGIEWEARFASRCPFCHATLRMPITPNRKHRNRPRRWYTTCWRQHSIVILPDHDGIPQSWRLPYEKD